MYVLACAENYAMQTISNACHIEFVWMITLCFIAFIDVVLRDAKYVQEVFLSLMQNETFANAWADHGMDSIVQTVAKVG